MGTKEDLFTSIPCEDEDDLDAVTALYEGVLYAIGQRRAAWLNERLRDIARGATTTAYCEHGAVTGEPCVQCELDLPPRKRRGPRWGRCVSSWTTGSTRWPWRG